MSGTTLNTLHLTDRPRSVRWTMLQVCIALIPGTCLYAFFVSAQVIINIVAAVTAAIVFEALCILLRRRSPIAALSDGSIVLAATLFALSVPPALPIWQLILGSAILASLGKHLFGGLGNNPFNPAMVAYACLLISFPVTMTDWNLPTISQADITWSAITKATPLDHVKSIDISNFASAALPTSQDFASLVFASPWPIVAVGWLLGGIYLLIRRVISWHIPSSVLISLALLYLLQSAFSDGISLPPIPAMLTGAIMFGAFFIATDPVTAASSKAGQVLFGSGIGILCFFIREYSVYPEGFAFAVLLMNMAVPLIDRLDTIRFRRARVSR